MTGILNKPEKGKDTSALHSQWYAVHTRSNFEFKVRNCLDFKSFDAFLPMIDTLSRRHDRRKINTIPMFPGYLFVQINLTAETHLDIVKTPGVVRLVGLKNRPISINPCEIKNIMILNKSGQPTIPHRFLKQGDKVMVMEGPLKGLKGIYQRGYSQHDRVVVSIDILQRAVVTEIDGWALESLAS